MIVDCERKILKINSEYNLNRFFKDTKKIRIMVSDYNFSGAI